MEGTLNKYRGILSGYKKCNAKLSEGKLMISSLKNTKILTIDLKNAKVRKEGAIDFVVTYRVIGKNKEEKVYLKANFGKDRD